jgi:hypothetical protein
VVCSRSVSTQLEPKGKKFPFVKRFWVLFSQREHDCPARREMDVTVSYILT